MKGYAICFVPRSWHLGRWTKPHKTLWALGPFRWVVYNNIPGKWGA